MFSLCSSVYLLFYASPTIVLYEATDVFFFPLLFFVGYCNYTQKVSSQLFFFSLMISRNRRMYVE